MKKLFVSLFTVLVGTLVLSGCSLSGDKAIIKSEKDVFNYTVLSAANLLSESASEAVTEETTPVEPNVPTTDVPEIVTPVEEAVDSILDKYLSLIETYLNNQVITSTEVASDKEAFETMVTYQTKNMFGEAVTYTVYYNIVLMTEDTDEDDLEDEQDMELEYELTGIIVIDGVEYELIGEKEVEADEVSYKFTSYIDQNNFIKISYEMDQEDQEQKFHFKQVTDGVIVYETKVKLENEDGKMAVKFSYKTATTSGKYVFKQNDSNSYDIKVKFERYENGVLVEQGQAKISILIDELTGELTYEYVLIERGNMQNDQHQNNHKHEHDNGHEHQNEHNHQQGNNNRK